MKVLVCDNYTSSSLALLKSKQENIEIVQSKNFTPTSEELKNVEALLIRSRTKVNQDLLANSQVKVVITATSGFDHIDLELCKKKDIRVFYTPEANAQSAAEHTLLLALAQLKKLKLSEQSIEKQQWKDVLKKGFELNGKDWGIIGLGNVGRKVAHLASAFGCQIKAYDPYLADEVFTDSGCEKMGLTELLRSCDIVSLHTPLTKETKNMINHRTLELFSEGSLLINTSRGEVVDENHLIDAIKKQQIAGAALDVFRKEPLPEDSPLRSCDKIIMTPHVAAYTEEAISRASQMAVEKLIDYLAGTEVKHQLPHTLNWPLF